MPGYVGPDRNHAEAHGTWPRQALQGVVSALEKRAQAAVVGDYRPITVLSMLCRTWSSIKSRQVLRYLASFAPASLHGNMPGQTAAHLWFALQLEIEEARSGRAIQGFVADLEKAYNLLPRTPVLAVSSGESCGVANPILTAWGGALVALERRFKGSGQCGAGAPVQYRVC